MNGKPKQSMQAFYPRQKWAKWMVKLPLYLWRLGLGPVSGKIFLVLTTTGRKSGLPRHTMVEYHVVNGKKVAPCAFGEKSQWYKNIQADPRVTVQTADGTERMRAVRVTDDEELRAIFDTLQRRDPALLNWYLQSLGIEPTAEAVIANKERVYFIRFDPTDEPTPPGLEVDLAWLWPAILLSMLARKMLRGRKR